MTLTVCPAGAGRDGRNLSWVWNLLQSGWMISVTAASPRAIPTWNARLVRWQVAWLAGVNAELLAVWGSVRLSSICYDLTKAGGQETMGRSLFLWCVFPLMKLSACGISPLIFIWETLRIFFAWEHEAGVHHCLPASETELGVPSGTQSSSLGSATNLCIFLISHPKIFFLSQL